MNNQDNSQVVSYFTLLRRALSSRYVVTLSHGHDHFITTRAVELSRYTDGCGFELYFLCYALSVGIERKVAIDPAWALLG